MRVLLMFWRKKMWIIKEKKMGKEDRKVFWGSVIFCIIVVVHILVGFFVNIENPQISIVVTQFLIVMF